ncbi:hypothetical protein JRQ81_018759, partial [Phrynocephalus forsythii]
RERERERDFNLFKQRDRVIQSSQTQKRPCCLIPIASTDSCPQALHKRCTIQAITASPVCHKCVKSDMQSESCCGNQRMVDLQKKDQRHRVIWFKSLKEKDCFLFYIIFSVLSSSIALRVSSATFPMGDHRAFHLVYIFRSFP